MLKKYDVINGQLMEKSLKFKYNLNSKFLYIN